MRKVRVVNVLTHQSDILSVCNEETIAEIQTRYMEYNSHADCYTWKQLKDTTFVKVEMDKTLDQIGLPDDSGLFDSIGISDDSFIPILQVYFDDDLTYS